MTNADAALMVEAARGAWLLETLAAEGVELGCAPVSVLAWLKGVQEVIERELSGVLVH